jgi:ATP-binding cassette subfamily B protein
LGLSITHFLQIIGYALGLAIGALLYTGGAVTIGTAFLIVYYIGMLAAPLDELRHQANSLQEASASVGRITELLDLRPQVREGADAALPTGALEVAFADVSFAYRDEAADGEARSVLSGVSFTLAAGRVLGVLGRTGSGKTTLTRLLFRLYDPDAGAICLGGVSLRDVRLDDLRRRVGMVTQDVQLFGASVRDNIRLFDPDVSDEAIRRSLAELGLLGWVEAMPGGLDAELATGGGGMSAGEAQLLAFARLLLRDPGLVILDEAAARLDPVTEARLERAIDRLLGPGDLTPLAQGSNLTPQAPLFLRQAQDRLCEERGEERERRRTAIIIAHRLSTVQRADDILILEEGRVVECGPREALAADPESRFAGLLRVGLEEALT